MSRATSRIAFLGLLPALFAALIFACSDEDAPPVQGTDDGGSPVTPEASVGSTDAANDAPVDEDGGLDAGEDGATDAGVICVFVSTSGSDTNEGTPDAPFRTISHALSVVGAALDGGVHGGVDEPRCVKVSPGTYDTDGGETFPLIVPAGTSLLGDEPSKGNGATPTLITGKLDIGVLPYPALVIPSEGATLAGFRLQVIQGGASSAVYVEQDRVTIRNNSFLDNDCISAVRFLGSDGLLAGNVIVNTKLSGGTSGTGLLFRPPSGRNRIEGNVIANNVYGLQLDSANENDFGGGPTGSLGGNELRCNTDNDVWTNRLGDVFFGRNNRWDHVPPTMGGGAGGIDVRNGDDGSASTFHLEGATLADAACP